MSGVTDASGLEITKVFVSSAVRAPNTGTESGKFTWQCPGDVIKKGNPCYVTISDLALANSFYNVSTHSDKIYYRRKLRALWVTGDNVGNFVDVVATLLHGWYSSSQLATVLTNAMTTANVGGPTMTVSFEANTQTLLFQEGT